VREDPFLAPATSYASPRKARAFAARDEDTRRVVDRLLALNATRPERARALHDLTGGERAALESLREKRLAIEVAKDLWYLHPFAWHERLDSSLAGKQVWLTIIVGVISLVLIWLRYLR
jgi:hypothetical protein